MANGNTGKKKTEAELAQRRSMEQARSGQTRRLTKGPAKTLGLSPVGEQYKTIQKQDYDFYPSQPGPIGHPERVRMPPQSLMSHMTAADPGRQHAVIRPDEDPARSGLVSPQNRAKAEAALRQKIELGGEEAVPPSAAPAGVGGITVTPTGVEGITVHPAESPGARPLQTPLEESGFTATDSRFGGKPLTRYEDGKGSFLETTGVRKGGGTLSSVRGPGAANYTEAEWKALPNEQKIQANVDSYKSQTAAVRSSMAGPGRAGAASGGALTGQQSPFERRKTLREYGMAVGELQNDMRRGRVSAKKGKVIAGMLKDQYDKVLGGDLQKLMQEEMRQEGQLMTQQARSEGLMDVAEERQRGALERTGMGGPETFSMEVVGENADGTKRYGLVGSQGTQSGAEAGQNPTDPAQLKVLMDLARQAVEALPEEQRGAGIAEYERRFPGESY